MAALAAARATIQRVSASRKPVIVRRLTLDWLAGYAPTALTMTGSSREIPELEVLLSSGKLLTIPWDQVKWVCYVRDLSIASNAASNDTVNPERLLRRRFTGRPRVAGAWLRLALNDGDELEGVVANDRSLIDGPGLLLTPPDTRSNTQRVFVPHGAIRDLTILGIIQPTTSRERTGMQAQLFEMRPVDRNAEPPEDSTADDPAELQSLP